MNSFSKDIRLKILVYEKYNYIDKYNIKLLKH